MNISEIKKNKKVLTFIKNVSTFFIKFNTNYLFLKTYLFQLKISKYIIFKRIFERFFEQLHHFQKCKIDCKSFRIFLYKYFEHYQYFLLQILIPY